jgi:hypothetical protein
MLHRLPVFLIFAAALFGATVKLYLKDGDYQLVREYQVQSDRVRYYSVERGEWEEIPLELVDLNRTKKEAAARQEAIEADVKAQEEEDAALRAERKEIASIPMEAGVYLILGEGKLQALKQAESKIVNDKKRTVLKVLSPVPIVPGKSTVELDGASAAFHAPSNRPEFYFRLSTEERFGIIQLAAKKNVRVAENVTRMPVGDEVFEEQKQVPTFKKQIGDLLFKIWPEKPLEPGEYALVQYTEGKVNMQVWDFSVTK